MAGNTQIRQGLKVDGLEEAIKALRKYDKEVGREAVDVMRDAAKDVQARSQARARTAPGGRYKTTGVRGVKIGRSATAKGAGVKLFARGTGMAAEWGSKWQPIWGEFMSQSRVTRHAPRTFAKPKGNSFDVTGGDGPGYVVQHTIRQRLPYWERTVADELFALLIRELNKAGVPK